MSDPVLGLLGIARRAGAVVVGEQALGKARRSLSLVILARDLSERRREDLQKVWAQSVPVALFGTKTALGGALGRQTVGIVGVTDASLAARLAVTLGVGMPEGEKDSEAKGGGRHKH